MKLLYSLLILSGFCFPQFSFAQTAPEIEWQKSFGGTSEDASSAIRQTTDGGFIIAGHSYSSDNDVTLNHGASDYWIVKTDGSGNILWQKSFGGSSNDVASDVQPTADGGYIVAGFSRSNNDDVTDHHGTTAYNDYWIVKLDSAGTIEWQKSLGGTANEFANSIHQIIDGGYVVAGYSASNDGDVTAHHGGTGTTDYWIVKLSETGNILWQKSLGGNASDNANAIQQTADQGFIVAGSSESNDDDVSGNHGFSDYWIIKLDSTGNIDWQKSLGGTGSDVASSIQQTSDGGFITAGWSNSDDNDVSGNHGSYDYEKRSMTSAKSFDLTIAPGNLIELS